MDNIKNTVIFRADDSDTEEGGLDESEGDESGGDESEGDESGGDGDHSEVEDTDGLHDPKILVVSKVLSVGPSLPALLLLVISVSLLIYILFYSE